MQQRPSTKKESRRSGRSKSPKKRSSKEASSHLESKSRRRHKSSSKSGGSKSKSPDDVGAGLDGRKKRNKKHIPSSKSKSRSKSLDGFGGSRTGSDGLDSRSSRSKNKSKKNRHKSKSESPTNLETERGCSVVGSGKPKTKRSGNRVSRRSRSPTSEKKQKHPSKGEKKKKKNPDVHHEAKEMQRNFNEGNLSFDAVDEDEAIGSTEQREHKKRRSSSFSDGCTESGKFERRLSFFGVSEKRSSGEFHFGDDFNDSDSEESYDLEEVMKQNNEPMHEKDKNDSRKNNHSLRSSLIKISSWRERSQNTNNSLRADNSSTAIAVALIDEEKKRNEKLMRQIEQLFNLFDRKGTGNLTKRDFTYFMNNIIGQFDDVNGLFVQIDTAGDGMISKYEFFRAILNNQEWADKLNELNAPQSERNGKMINEVLAEKIPTLSTRQMFELYDVDGNGSISVDEVKFVMKKMFGMPISVEEIKNRLKEADVDGKGEISLDEFVMFRMKADSGNRDVARSVESSPKKKKNDEMLASTARLLNRRMQESQELVEDDVATSLPTTTSKREFRDRRTSRRSTGVSASNHTSSRVSRVPPRRARSSTLSPPSTHNHRVPPGRSKSSELSSSFSRESGISPSSSSSSNHTGRRVSAVPPRRTRSTAVSSSTHSRAPPEREKTRSSDMLPSTHSRRTTGRAAPRRSKSSAASFSGRLSEVGTDNPRRRMQVSRISDLEWDETAGQDKFSSEYGFSEGCVLTSVLQRAHVRQYE